MTVSHEPTLVFPRFPEFPSFLHIPSWYTDRSLQPEKKQKEIYFIYHSPCQDGFGAAWAFYKSLLIHPPAEPTKVIFVPESHRWRKTEELLQKDISQAEIIYADICPKRELLLKVHERAKKLRVFDHHKTAMEDCGDLPFCFFDMTRSGAGIIWDVFVQQPRGLMIRCVEARDLWKQHTIPYCDEILIVLGTYKRKFAEWDKFNDWLNTAPAEVINKGKSYVEYKKIVQDMLLGRKIHKLKIGGMILPATNSSVFQSELGHTLTTQVGPAGAVWYFNGKYFAFSLRSEDKGPDVSELAKKYGGGGHRNAAGFAVDKLEDLAKQGGSIEPYTDDELASMNLVLNTTEGADEEQEFIFLGTDQIIH